MQLYMQRNGCPKTDSGYTSAMKLALSLLLMTLLLVACSEPDKPGVELYVAIKRGDIDQLERHIYWKTDLNSINAEGNSPLHESAIAGRMVMARLLLRNGARVNEKNRAGKTALQLALENGRTQLADVLISQFAAEFDATELLFSILLANVTDRDVIGFLANKGADTNALNTAGETPLTLAIKQANRLQAKHLIANKADVNQANRAGELPLALALKNNTPEIARLLESHGALPSAN